MKLKKNHTERRKFKLTNEWRKRVSKGGIEPKDVKVFASTKNFVEGKKIFSCSDFLIKKSDAVC